MWTPRDYERYPREKLKLFIYAVLAAFDNFRVGFASLALGEAKA